MDTDSTTSKIWSCHQTTNCNFSSFRDKSVEDLLAWEADPLAFKVLVKNNFWLGLACFDFLYDDN